MPLPRRAALLLASLAVTALRGHGARAAWPEHPLRLVAPFPPGSGTDILARLLAEQLGRVLGQPVVVENRPGGNGVVGAQAVALAPADGSTLLMFGTSVAAINPHVLRHLPYDPVRDFAPIGTVAEQPYVLGVPPDAPDDSLPGWLEAVRGRDLTFAYGNAGSQIMGAMLANLGRLRLTGVPYRGSAEALTDVSAGRVDCNFADFGLGMAQQRAGRVRALAESLEHAFPLSPDVPPLASALPGFDASVWFSMVAPAATPEPVLAKLSGGLDEVLADPGFGDRLAKLGVAPLRMAPAAFGTHLRAELALWGERVRLAGIEPQ